MSTVQTDRDQIPVSNCVLVLPADDDDSTFEANFDLQGIVVRGSLFILGQAEVQVLAVFSVPSIAMLVCRPGDVLHLEGTAEFLGNKEVDLARFGVAPTLLMRDPEVHQWVSSTIRPLLCRHCADLLHRQPDKLLWEL